MLGLPLPVLAFTCLPSQSSDGIDFDSPDFLNTGFSTTNPLQGTVLTTDLADLSGGYASREVVLDQVRARDIVTSSIQLTRLDQNDLLRRAGSATRYRADVRVEFDYLRLVDQDDFIRTVLEGSFEFWLVWQHAPSGRAAGWQARTYFPDNTALEGEICTSVAGGPLLCNPRTEPVTQFGLCQGPMVERDGDRAYPAAGLELILSTRGEVFSLELPLRTGFPVGRGPASEQPTGSIDIQLISLDPLALAGSDPPVREAAVTLIRQSGIILPQQAGETEAAYQARLRAALDGREGDTDFVTVSTDGGVRFDGLDLLQPATGESGDSPQQEPVFYAAVISGARTLEDDLDTIEEEGVLVTGFFGATRTNLLALSGTPNVRTIGLKVADGTVRKRAMAESLDDLASNNLGPLEGFGGDVQNWLDTLESATPTEAQIEGVNRAYWAELAARDAYRYADPLLEASLNAAASIAGKVIDFLADSINTYRVSRRQSEVNERVSQPGALSALGQNGWNGTANADPLDLIGNVDNAALTGPQRKFLEDLSTLLKTPLKAALRQVKFRLAQEGENAAVVGAVIDGFGAALEASIDQVFTGVGGLKGVTKFAIEGIVKLQKRSLLDGDSEGAVARRLRGPLPGNDDDDQLGALRYSYDQMRAWSEADPDVYRQERSVAARTIDQINQDGTTAIRTVIAAEFVVEATEQIGELLETAGTAGDVFPAKRFVETVNGLVNKAALGGLFILPMTTVYDLPNQARTAAFRAFGETPPPAPKGKVAGVELGALTGDDALVDSLTPAIDDLAGKLTALETVLRADNPVLLLETLATPDEGLADLIEAFRVESKVLLEQALTGEFGSGAAGEQVFNLLIDRDRALLELQEVYERGREIAYDILAGRFDGPADTLYRIRRDRLVSLIDEPNSALGDLKADLPGFLFNASVITFNPRVIVTSVDIVSQSTGLSSLSANDERFTVTATLANPTSQPLDNIAVRLVAGDPGANVTQLGSDIQAIGSLGGNDGIPESGQDRQSVSWQIQFTGDFGDGPLLPLQFEVLESGAEPTTFLADRHLAMILPNPEAADPDGDLLSLYYELEHGLDPDADDALADKDGDGLSNLREQRLRTLASVADSDADGLDDGEEVLPGADGVRTDPLNEDTDGDGVKDGEDPEPANPLVPDVLSTETPARTASAQGEPVVALDQQQIVLSASDFATFSDFVARIQVSNGGEGELRWRVEPLVPELVEINPPPGELRTGPGEISISLNRIWLYDGALSVPIRVIDEAGAIRDMQTINVQVGGGEVQSYVLETRVVGKGRVTSDDGRVNCSDACERTYTMGSTLTLTPVPDPGWHFVRWQGGANCNGLLIVDGNRACRAEFISEDLLFKNAFEIAP